MGKQRLIKFEERRVKQTDNMGNPLAAAFSGAIIDLCYNLIKFLFGDLAKVGSLWELKCQGIVYCSFRGMQVQAAWVAHEIGT
jgi:hypothetical protein